MTRLQLVIFFLLASPPQRPAGSPFDRLWSKGRSEAPVVVQEASNGKVYFQPKGRMVGSITYGHLIFRLDPTKQIREAEVICADLIPKESEWPTAPLHEKEGWAEVWKDAYKGLREGLHDRCTENIEGMKATTNAWTAQQASGREKRFAATLLRGAMGLVSAAFTGYQIYEAIEAAWSGDPKTVKLPALETDKYLTNRDFSRLRKMAKAVVARIKDSDTRYDVLLESMGSAGYVLSRLEDMGSRLRDRFSALSRHRLDPRATQMDKVKTAMHNLKNQVRHVGLRPLMERAEDVYELETSHVPYENGTIDVLVHVPLRRGDSMYNLYKYVGAPTVVAGDQFLRPEPQKELLAVSTGGEAFRELSASDLEGCKRFRDIYACPQATLHELSGNPSCLMALYNGRAAEVKELCPFTSKPAEDQMVQLSPGRFILYQPEASKVTARCPGFADYSWTTTGVAEDIAPGPGCQASSSSFTFEGSFNTMEKERRDGAHPSDGVSEANLGDLSGLLPEAYFADDNDSLRDALRRVSSVGGVFSLTDLSEELDNIQTTKQLFWILCYVVIGILIVLVFSVVFFTCDFCVRLRVMTGADEWIEMGGRLLDKTERAAMAPGLGARGRIRAHHRRRATPRRRHRQRRPPGPGPRAGERQPALPRRAGARQRGGGPGGAARGAGRRAAEHLHRRDLGADRGHLHHHDHAGDRRRLLLLRAPELRHLQRLQRLADKSLVLSLFIK